MASSRCSDDGIHQDAGQFTYLIDLRMHQAFRPQPAKRDETLWYRLHRLAKRAPKTVGHEFSEVAAAKRFSMRSAWSSGSSPICREGKLSDCTLPLMVVFSTLAWYKIPHLVIPFLEGQLEFLAPSCADKLSLFFLVGAFAGHCSFQGCCSCSSTDMRHKANDSLLVLRINRTGSNRSRWG